MECAKEWYCLWLTKHTHPPAIEAGFALIESSIFNTEFTDAVLYAHTTWETLTRSQDSHIPDNRLQEFIAQGTKLLAKALFALAQSGGMPAEEQQAAGVEAIMLARRALEIHTQENANSSAVAEDMGTLALVLDHFNDVDDDEVFRLYEQAITIYARVHGSLSPNVATCEGNLGLAYSKRAKRAAAASDHDRYVANLELALPRHREAARIYQIANRMVAAEAASQDAAFVEESLRLVAAFSR